MIKDKLTNAECSYSLSNNLRKGFLWLKENNLETLKDGKYEIDGDKIFANVQSYETKDDAPYEAHKKYLDIQYMIKGEENVGVVDYKDCETTEVYNEEKDVEFLNCVRNDFYQILRKGEFLIFYPQDAHKPSLKVDSNKSVKKVIVKVMI